MGKLRERMVQREKDLAEGRYPSLELHDRDAIKWEVLYTRLLGIVSEGRETGRLISASPTVREFGECVFCVFTPEGEVAAFSRGILLHFASFAATIKWMLANDYEEDPGIKDGDIFCNNDPMIGGAHSADVATFMPVFYRGELVAWVGGLTHVMEVGGTEPGGTSPSAMSRYDDGLMISAQKVGSNDKFDRLYHLNVSRNTRDGSWWILDDLAKLGGCMKMKEALVALIDEYGIEYYEKAVYEMIEEGRRFAINKIKTVLYPGRYRTVNFYDILNAQQPVRFQKDYYIHQPLEMTVTRDGALTLDYDGLSSPGYHANNASLICARGLHIYQLIQEVLYDGMFNSGVVQGLELKFPEDSVLNPGIQYACAVWATAKTSAGGCFQRALSRAYFAKGFREEGFASKAITSAVFAGGVDENDRQFGIQNFEMNSSGGPAMSNKDGMDAANSVWNPEAQLSDVEPFEPIWPLRWLGRGVQTDGGGCGKHRGGATIASLYVIEPPVKFVESGSIMSGDKVFLSAGTMGGYPAPARYRYTMRDTNFAEAAEKQLPLPHQEGRPDAPDFARLLEGRLVRSTGQSASVQFERYDVIYQTSGGGGGWGDPLERPPELVVKELNDGLVFRESAEKVYGVVTTMATDSDIYVLDVAKTSERREAIRKERLSRAIPTKEFLAGAREDVVAGSFAPIVKEMYNDSFKNSPRFLQEYREFWDLPETFSGF
jgi:acetone carboxylase, alpha subunit